MAYMNPRLILLVLWTCLAGILPVSAQQSDTRVALLIGNAAYPDAEAPLRDPVNNVRSLADELRQTGFDVDIGENLTKEAMRAAIDRFYGKIKPGSTALLFFSGYGIQSDRQTYVIPVNAQIWTEADVRRDGYSLDILLVEMNKRGANVKIAILDASRRNPFERRFRAVAGGLAPVIVPKGTVVMYAAAPGADAFRGLVITAGVGVRVGRCDGLLLDLDHGRRSRRLFLSLDHGRRRLRGRACGRCEREVLDQRRGKPRHLFALRCP